MPSEKNCDEDFTEIDYIRRLYRILLTPTADWIESREERSQLKRRSAKNGDINESVFSKVRKKIGLGDGLKRFGNVGFKSIRQKSLHFQSTRFRETLIEISMLC